MAAKLVRWVWSSCQSLTDIQPNQTAKGSKTAPIAIISNNKLNTTAPKQPCKETGLEEPVISAKYIPEETVNKVEDMSLGKTPHSTEELVRSSDSPNHAVNKEEELPIDGCYPEEGGSEGVTSASDAEEHAVNKKTESEQAVHEKTESEQAVNEKTESEQAVNEISESEQAVNEITEPEQAVKTEPSARTNHDPSEVVSDTELLSNDSPEHSVDKGVETSSRTSHHTTQLTSEEAVESAADSTKNTADEIETLSKSSCEELIEELVEPVCASTEQAANISSSRTSCVLSIGSSRASCASTGEAEYEESTAVIKAELTRIQSYIEESILLDCHIPKIGVREDENATDEEIVESAIADITKNIVEITKSSTKRQGMYIEVPIVPIYTELVESTNIKKSTEGKRTRPSSCVNGIQKLDATKSLNVDCKRHTLHCDTPSDATSDQPNIFSNGKTECGSSNSEPVNDNIDVKRPVVQCDSSSSCEEPVVFTSIKDRINRFSLHTPNVVRLSKRNSFKSERHKHKSMPPFEGDSVDIGGDGSDLHTRNTIDTAMSKIDESNIDQKTVMGTSTTQNEDTGINTNGPTDAYVEEEMIYPSTNHEEMSERISDIEPTANRMLDLENDSPKAMTENDTSTELHSSSSKHICEHTKVTASEVNTAARRDHFMRSPRNKQKKRQSYPQGLLTPPSVRSARSKQESYRHSVHVGVSSDTNAQCVGNDQQNQQHSSPNYRSDQFVQSSRNKKKMRQSYPQRLIDPESPTKSKQNMNRHSVHVNISSETTVQSPCNGPCNGHWNHRPYSSADYAHTKFMQAQWDKQKTRQSYPQGHTVPTASKGSRREIIMKRLSDLINASSHNNMQPSCNDQQDHEEIPANSVETKKCDVPSNQTEKPTHKFLRSHKINTSESQNNTYELSDKSLLTEESSCNKCSMHGYSSTETTAEDDPEGQFVTSNPDRIRNIVEDFNRAQLTLINQELSTPVSTDSGDDLGDQQSRKSWHHEDTPSDFSSKIMTMNWEIEKQITGIEGGIDIGVLANGNIAITDFKASNVKVYSMEDQYQTRLVDIVSSKEVAGKWFPFGIATDPDGDYYLTNKSSFVDVFSSQSEHIAIFPSSSPSSYLPTAEKTISFGGIAINQDGHIFVGLCRTNHINIHTQDGSHIGSIKVSIKPRFLSVCSNGNIVVSAWELNTSVQIIDPQNGQVLHTLNAPAGVPHWCPSGVHCHKDVIFVSNCPRTCDTPDGIYCFSATGEYIGCVTNEVFFPLGLTMDGNRLMVVELRCVKIFHAK